MASGVKVYHHKTVEEVRTEKRTVSSGGAPKTSTVNSHLSELDNLLQDLNNARQAAVFKDQTDGAANGPRPSVDSLLDELNSVSHTDTKEIHTTKQDVARQQYQPSSVETQSASVHTSHAVNPSASNATKELDELMASLSDFKKESLPAGNVHSEPAVVDFPPPRPPSPDERDMLAVPPPRPPPPFYVATCSVPVEITVPALLPYPPTPPPVSEYSSRPENLEIDEPYVRSASGGPVKRNDAEYRWVTDEIQHEVRQIVEFPCVAEKINASSLQSQVDTAYAKPQKPPKEPSPPNQLDSMLGSLTSHMTEQGVTTTQKGCCCACSKPIVGQVITALGKTWHPEHFTCAHCNKELGTQNFFEREGKPYCEPDYHNLFSPRCAYCNGPILDKCVTALDKAWHPEHFFCAQCGNTFGDEGFHEKDGKPYCKQDYFNMFAPKCGGCSSPIMENYISALSAQWHPECFVCRDCKENMVKKSYYDVEGTPVCNSCLGVSDDEDEEDD